MIGIVTFVIGFALSSGLFLLGYHIGRNHERKGWARWLDVKIPRLSGERPWFASTGPQEGEDHA